MAALLACGDGGARGPGAGDVQIQLRSRDDHGARAWYLVARDRDAPPDASTDRSLQVRDRARAVPVITPVEQTALGPGAQLAYRRDMVPARWLAVLAVTVVTVVSGCSGGADAPDAATAIDAASDAAVDVDGGAIDGGTDGRGPDGAQACVLWDLAPRPASSIAIHDDPGPFNSARTVRILVQYTAADSELAAMPRLTRGPGTITIEPMVFEPGLAGVGADRTRRLIVPLVLATGTWQIVAAAPTPVALTLTIGPAPLRPCGITGACAMDCDCDLAAGQRCLSGFGFGGGFTECARPCEVDRDCGGGAVCASVVDGLTDACSDLTPECGPTVACPVGFACQAGACAPTFVLGQGTRHPCSCDAECDPGLRCVTGAATEVGRCEVACPTAGPWCQGAHVCGPASADLSGLATSDSVCGWLGE